MGQCAQQLWRLCVLGAVSASVSGCYFANFFKKKSSSNSTSAATYTSGGVIGTPLGAKAGGPNYAALAAVAAVATTHPPAVVRPDPDTYARSLIRQYRPESTVVAQQIGKVDQFRLLLGGAPQDFATAPQQTYDATSLLAVSKVAEQVCVGLVAPIPGVHGDWSSILPYPPSAEQSNIAWLAQRITGRPSAAIDSTMLQQLTAIMVAEEPYLSTYTWNSGSPYGKYVPVCTTLSLDSQSLYF